MLFKLYRYKDLLVIPNMVLTDEGTFIETEPVAILDIKEKERILEILFGLLQAEPEQAKQTDLYENKGERFLPQSAVLSSVGLNRWQDFEKDSVMFNIHYASANTNANASINTNENLMVHKTGRGSNGLWSLHNSEEISLPVESTDQEFFAKLAEQVYILLENCHPSQKGEIRLLGGASS